MSETTLTKADDIDYIKTEAITFEVHSFYDDKTTLDELIKNYLRRNAENVLRQLDNN